MELLAFWDYWSEPTITVSGCSIAMAGEVYRGVIREQDRQS